MEWLSQFLDQALGQVPGLVLAAVPAHLKKQCLARLGDLDPFKSITANHDLVRATRLAWIEAAQDVMKAARARVEKGEWREAREAVAAFDRVVAAEISKARDLALDRDRDPGASPIDRHVRLVIDGVPELAAPGADPAIGAPITDAFAEVLAELAHWPVAEVPPIYASLARQGLPMPGGGPSRPFGDLVFAAFAEILKDPANYPQAREALHVAMNKALHDLLVDLHAVGIATQTTVDGIDAKIDLLLARTADAKPRRIRTTIPALRDLDYVGREEKFGEIAAALDDPAKDRVVVLHGPAGVGKSELALEFARRNAERYPGGTFLLDGSPQSLAIDLARLAQTVLDFTVPTGMPIEDQAVRALQMLGDAPTLLVYDNVGEERTLRPWLPPHGMPCHVIATSVRDGWPPLCRPIAIDPLSEEEALRIVAAAAGPELARDHGPELVRAADGLAVQLVPTARALRRQAERGRIRPAVLAHLADATNGSFSAVYGVLGDDARLLLHAAAWLDPQRIPEAELRLVLERGAGWSADTVADALDECQDLHVLQGATELRMHQLFSRFVAERAPGPEIAATLPGILAAQAGRLVEIARKLAANPNQPDLAGLLAVYAWDPAVWAARGVEIAIGEGEVVGKALYEIGRFAEAQPWFERAVDAKQPVGARRRVNWDSLGYSLHEVGFCLLNLGHFVDAQSWFERAVRARERGDPRGRVNHRAVGNSMDQVGRCLLHRGDPAKAQVWFERAVAAKQPDDVDPPFDYESVSMSLHHIGISFSSRGDFAAARQWYEEAVTAAELGDLNGRVNHASLGISLHQVAFCLGSLGDFAAARPWLKRAVKAARQGDLYGRVNNASIAASLHLLGQCDVAQCNIPAALRLFKCAVNTGNSGDIFGRVDRVSLARSLRSVAACLRELGREDEVGEWERRADEIGS